MIPLPPVSPDILPGTNEYFGGGGTAIPGGGNNYHRSTERWTDDLVREARNVNELGSSQARKYIEQPPVGGKYFFYPARNRTLY